ncbi:MAG: thiol peroxidase [bacterium]
MQERAGAFLFKDQQLTVLGAEVKVGDKAPEFTVAENVAKHVHAQDILAGKVTILSAVPSLDTGICDAQTRRFNEEVSKMGGKAQVATISMDLPMAQARWCGAAGLDNALIYSDHRDASFGKAFGCLVKELRLLQRSVFVVDQDGVIRYAEYVPEIGQHPDYEKALAAVNALI